MAPFFQFGANLHEVVDFTVIRKPESVLVAHGHMSRLAQIQYREAARTERDLPADLFSTLRFPTLIIVIEKQCAFVIGAAMTDLSSHACQRACRNAGVEIFKYPYNATHTILPTSSNKGNIALH